jgi:hypothetical protein
MDLNGIGFLARRGNPALANPPPVEIALDNRFIQF